LKGKREEGKVIERTKGQILTKLTRKGNEKMKEERGDGGIK
jgi:hypothetical protein